MGDELVGQCLRDDAVRWHCGRHWDDPFRSVDGAV